MFLVIYVCMCPKSSVIYVCGCVRNECCVREVWVWVGRGRLICLFGFGFEYRVSFPVNVSCCVYKFCCVVRKLTMLCVCVCRVLDY